MYIFNLQLTNFRNYVRTDVRLEKGLNLFIGENAQGKSNLLEAIYLLSTLRSSRASTDADLVRRDIIPSDFPVARLSCEVERSAGNLSLDLAIVGRTTDATHRAGKRVRVNGVPKKASDAVGQLCAVLFTTLDIEIVAGPPLMRRRYLDMMISQVDRGYLRAMQKYSKVPGVGKRRVYASPLAMRPLSNDASRAVIVCGAEPLFTNRTEAPALTLTVRGA